MVGAERFNSRPLLQSRCATGCATPRLFRLIVCESVFCWGRPLTAGNPREQPQDQHHRRGEDKGRALLETRGTPSRARCDDEVRRGDGRAGVVAPVGLPGDVKDVAEERNGARGHDGEIGGMRASVI